MHALFVPTLGAADTSRIVFWVALLIGVVLVGSIAVFIVRRKLLSKDVSTGDDLGVLDSLRAMRDSGTMSDEEYAAARKAIVEKAGKRAAQSIKHEKPAKESS